MKTSNNMDITSLEDMNLRDNQEQNLTLDFRSYTKIKETDIHSKNKNIKAELFREFEKMFQQKAVERNMSMNSSMARSKSSKISA